MSKKSEIESFVGRKIYAIQAMADSGSGKAILANLRRGIGYEPGELPQLFGIFLSDMPEDFLSDDGNATKEEWVCYTALTLYALHQQGYHAQNQRMHTDEVVSMGKALQSLKNTYDNDPNAENRMIQKLRAITTSVDRKELSHHLRGMVQLLKSKGIPINYKKLAGDLYEMQFPEGKKQVCLRWGQDFYRRKNITQNNEDENREEKNR